MELEEGHKAPKPSFNISPHALFQQLISQSFVVQKK